ncbi:electron transfer flavoprotein [Candidatus Entotheonella serta]|nr:electron transfer flavoprotein [Candidatus Entotheonella serta]
MAGILVIGEVQDGHLAPPTREALAMGRNLAEESGATVVVVLIGSELGGSAQEAIATGADHAYTVEDALLGQPQIDLYLAAYQAVCAEVTPDIVLLSRTDIGRELAPRLACRLGVSLLQDCLQLEIDADSGRLIATRPVYGGNVQAKVKSTGTPQVAALRPKVCDPLEPDTSRQGEVTPVSVALDAAMAKVTIVRQEISAGDGVKLEDANIVVAGGRGLGGPEPFSELEELAGLLEAGIGASRAAVDAGWVPANWQIGLTGRTITPDLYLTVGISGASQHMAGCSNSKVIVAINKDSEANIFRESRYGVVGDWETVLPGLIQGIRDLK